MEERVRQLEETLRTKEGEISILRSKLKRTTDEYYQKYMDAKRELAELNEKIREAEQAAAQDRKKLETENLFLQDELREEMQRRNQQKLKNKIEDKPAPTTPRHQRTLLFRDGFDDTEIGAPSPTKSVGGRSRRSTPSMPAKRKRKPSQDSPIPMAALELSPAKAPPSQAAASESELFKHKSLQPRQRQKDRSLHHMKQILAHRTPPNIETDLEVMAQLAFPSEPSRKLSSIVLEETSSSTSDNYAVDFARSIISIWSRAINEQYYKPISMFISWVRFIVQLDMTTIVPAIVKELAHVICKTVRINGTVRFEHSPVSSVAPGQVRRTPRSLIHEEASTTEALDLLYIVSTACRRNDKAHETLWKTIPHADCLSYLNDHQLLKDIVLAVNILSTSLRRDTFGPIIDYDQQMGLTQREAEQHLIERAVCLLSEYPVPDEGRDDYLPAEVCEMRLEVLSMLEIVAFQGNDPESNWGSALIASSKLTLGRIFRNVYDELDALQTLRPEHDLRTALVNRMVHLLYGVLKSSEGVDLRSILGRLVGGREKHILALVRLAYSDAAALESGITVETMTMARELFRELDMGPGEYEAFIQAFPSGGVLGRDLGESQQEPEDMS